MSNTRFINILGFNKLSDSNLVRCLALGGAVGLLGWELADFQSAQLRRLRETVLSRSTNTEGAHEAIKKLDRWWNFGGTQSLIRIAIADKEFLDDRQEFAIQAIAARHSAEINARIASLLVPHVGLSRREAASTALENNVCNDKCAQLILHYLERVWSGTARGDDVTLAAIDLTSSPDDQIEKEHAQMISQLCHTLRINPTSTLRVLHDTYGLGSSTPSSFSLRVLGATELNPTP